MTSLRTERADSRSMKRTFAAIAGALVAVIAVAPAASAERTLPSPPVIAPAPPVPLPPVEPTVDLFPLDQFEFLGYKVSKKAIETKPTSKDRAEIKRFQSKFGLKQTGKADKATLKALNKYAGNAEVPERCKTAKWTLCADKYAKVLRVVDSDGNLVRVRDVRFGGPGLETRNGTFSVYRKSKDHVSSEYHVPMPDALFFSGGQAVHYSYEFARYRYAKPHSHGCIGAYDREFTSWLFAKTPIGSKVVVYDGPPR